MKAFRDASKSYLSSEEIARYKSEITKQEGGVVCRRKSTMDVADVGAKAMAADGFRLVKEQMDV